MEYDKLLDNAYKNIKKIETTERFEIPKARTQIQGNKTMIQNFLQICSAIRRDCQHLAKYLCKELATPVAVEKERAILNRRVSAMHIDGKIEAYVKEFVTCPECGKPDTELIKERGFLFIHCLACGAKHTVRVRI